MTDGGDGRPDLGLGRAHTARIYDYLLGGKDNYAADREAAALALRVQPHARTVAHANRAFMHRVTRVLAAEYGVRQWLDIGTGIPTRPNLHEVAQSVAPEARVVYVDNDRVVLAHATALLGSAPEGRTAYVHADATRPRAVLEAPELAETLDLDRPVALSLNALLHFLPGDPRDVVGPLMDALPSGSVLALTHATRDLAPEMWDAIAAIYRGAGNPLYLRTHAEVRGLFDGLDMVAPGLVIAHRWRPQHVGTGATAATAAVTDADVSLWAGVGVKP
ncbi:SAM-dependent methyltransferase [Streptomyces avicenniae]|uniref:SAM-dependent methyltransferase n=1 Tax=Streptomyces avicenniae TaxID=500153 RepID=UPI000699F6A5|nr:SAM-dependent methyltransferase [Streptomyces avicenniae]